MDNLLYNFKKQKEYKKTILNKEELKDIIENNIYDLLGVKLIQSNYYINKDNSDYIETLGLDENLNLVIIEYRIGKFSRVIQNGLIHIDFIKEHLSAFKLLINDNISKLELSKDDIKNINYNARLVVISQSFHKFDGDSIMRMPYNIDLLTLNYYNKEFITINKSYTSRNIDINNLKCVLNETDKKLLFSLNDFVLSLGEEVNINGYNNVISYRKIRTFMYVIISNGIQLLINGKMKEIKTNGDILKLEKDIENCYDKR